MLQLLHEQQLEERMVSALHLWGGPLHERTDLDPRFDLQRLHAIVAQLEL